MSFTFQMFKLSEYEFNKINTIVNESDNWDIIFKLFHNFAYYKGWRLSDNIGIYANMHSDLLLEFWNDKRVMYSPTWTYEDFKKWFIDWLKHYEEIKLTEVDYAKIDKIIALEKCKGLRK